MSRHPTTSALSFPVGSPSTWGFYSCGRRGPHPHIINMHPLKIQGNQHQMLAHGETACFLSPHPPAGGEAALYPTSERWRGTESAPLSPSPWGLTVTPRPRPASPNLSSPAKGRWEPAKRRPQPHRESHVSFLLSFCAPQRLHPALRRGSPMLMPPTWLGAFPATWGAPRLRCLIAATPPHPASPDPPRRGPGFHQGLSPVLSWPEVPGGRGRVRRLCSRSAPPRG